MKYLENSIKFLIKYWILAAPLFILTALAYLLNGSNTGNLINLMASYSSFDIFDKVPFLGSILPYITSYIPAGGGFWIFVASFISIPITYGLVNKNLETGSSNLNECGQALNQNFIKYVMYFVGTLVLTIGIIILSIIIILITFLIAFIPVLGIIINSIIYLALSITVFVFTILLSMWLSAMVVDGLDVVAAAKKSIEVVKGTFWTILGISILVGIVCGLVGLILNLLAFIPFLGPIISSIVPTIKTFIMVVFLLTVYREKTGRINSL